MVVRFGGIVALDGVSFDMSSGQILGLIGPNGAGKTTLFNCLQPALHAELGRHPVRGPQHSGPAAAPHSEIGIGRTFQNLALFRTMTVLDNVLVGGHTRTPQRLPQRRAAPALGPAAGAGPRRARRGTCSTFSICVEVAHRPVAGLPFGTQKRVELARALASAPEAAAARRAGRRPQPRRGRGSRPPDPADPRRARRHGAAGRASHEPRDVDLRQGRRARFRPQDRRRHARRGAEATPK